MPIIGPRKSPRRPARAAVRGIFMLLAVIQWPPLQAGPPRSAKNADDLAGYDASITTEDRGHWAFQPIKSQPAPNVKNTHWVRNPIDRFVLAKLEEQGLDPRLRPSPESCYDDCSSI